MFSDELYAGMKSASVAYKNVPRRTKFVFYVQIRPISSHKRGAIDMPLLKKITTLEQEAEDFGFRWENTDQIMAQIKSECAEIQEHLHDRINETNKSLLQEEIGDLLHAVFSLCVFCKFDPTETLTHTLNKFERRLNAVKKLTNEQGLDTLNGHEFNELMAFWDKAKKLVG